MMWEGVQGEEEEAHTDIFRFIPLVVLSLATSIDALAVGVSFGVLMTAVMIPALIIGIVCCAISFSGVMLGKKLGNLLGNRMEIAGGLILILIGVRILAEHLIP
jgi:manganese efflux pump family protein